MFTVSGAGGLRGGGGGVWVGGVKGLNLSQMRFLGHLNLLNPLKRFAVLLHVKGLKNPKSLIFAYWDT